ncbi:MAG: hypothetical protein ABIP97_01210 [Chthoniobacterales bacterium]
MLILLGGCSDQINRSYATLQDAQEAIKKGWIPGILPPSTHSIRESHNLNVNTGSGSFAFDPKDKDYIFTQGASIEKIHPAFGTQIYELQKQGYGFAAYSRENSAWRIAIHPSGKGHYWLKDTQ